MHQRLVDPASFTVLDSGYTIAFSLPSSVPEPGTIPLAILGVALLLQLSRHRGLSNLSLGAMRKLP
ncbi:MAG: PEP-CTERM sorting domain-containing protein [Candidatus Accumulibacter sp.]|uniref:PEP-CTERM sorting domain-containing protein n=1 Tax=Accumulibacter sp. TaxID=2053492 RepID=UPI001ACC0386|nr:PEP-CTERM sorting domain-containing protein [Accumulibacter sp.]MBO3709017.1 PEP-CTERM sorting domain-containing protein [Accumulibacter sp.]